jgi:hypothetical protein
MRVLVIKGFSFVVKVWGDEFIAVGDRSYPSAHNKVKRPV